MVRRGVAAALLVMAGALQLLAAPPDAAASDGACEAGSAASEALHLLTEEAPGEWSGFNPAQGLRARFTGPGIELTPAASRGQTWIWSLHLVVQGPAGSPRAVAGRWPVTLGNRVELPGDDIVEWYRNSRKGIEHGLDIPSLAEPGLLAIEFALGGGLTPKIAADSRSITFTDGRGAPVLGYRSLRALDAAGSDVDARWQEIEDDGSRGLRLLLDAADARLPIQVRGLLTSPKRASALSSHVDDALTVPSLAAPSNDQCSGADVIPAAGPFPFVTTARNMTDATTVGDPPTPSCQSNLSRSVWYRFTPSAAGIYTFSLCSDAPTLSTLEDTVLAIYSASGSCTGLSELVGGCDDDSCTGGELQSVVSNISLASGTTYYIVAWKYDAAAPPAGEANVQLRVTLGSPSPGPPNDQCVGTAVIPGAGPFPHLTPIIADVSNATSFGDPPAPDCQPSVSRSVWYAFTPTSSGSYTFSTCADAPTGTTADDTVMALYAAGGTCSGLSQVAGACNDDGCVVEGAQSKITGASLNAGTLYYLLVWQFGDTPPAAGNTALQVRVTQSVAPGNDSCGSAVPLTLNNPVMGTTIGTINDYQLPVGSTCFTGIGQTVSTAPGGDAVYRFTAPSAGSYSFRATGYDTTKNLVLNVASDCPGGPAPATVTGCLGAANRNTGGGAEEVKCLPLTAAQQVYVYVDEHAVTAGSTGTMEVSPCTMETEPNGTTAQAEPLQCGFEGAVAPIGETDFYSFGVPVSGSRVFAIADGVASNTTDYDLRVTTSTDTLEFDNNNNDVFFGSTAPNISGAPLTGVASYIRVSHGSVTLQAEPYRLYGVIEPPRANATAESEPNNTPATATIGANLWFSGAIGSGTDVDHFTFSAQAGEILTLGLDLDPNRDNTPFNGVLALLDGAGAALITVNDAANTSSTTPGTGSLTSTTPNSPGEAIVWRVRTSGTYTAKVSGDAGVTGDYLLSVARNCRVGPPTDLAVAQTDSPDPVAPSSPIVYTVTVSNPGGAAASLVRLTELLPAGSSLTSAVPSQGACAGSGPVVCELGSLAAGGSAQVTITVTAPAAPGAIASTARVSSAVIDTNPGNDQSVQSTTVASADSDGDGVADGADCAPGDPTAFAIPGDATDLLYPDGADTSAMQWTPPALPGGTGLRFDLLRATVSNDWSARVCIASNQAGASASDPAPPGAIFYYIVRSENACGGTLGTNSSGTPITAPSCP